MKVEENCTVAKAHTHGHCSCLMPYALRVMAHDMARGMAHDMAHDMAHGLWLTGLGSRS